MVCFQKLIYLYAYQVLLKYIIL